MLTAWFFSYLAIEPDSQRRNKILITEYDFAVNAVTAIDKVFISHNLVNKLFIAKMSLSKILIFSML